jgi:transposase-like protein
MPCFVTLSQKELQRLEAVQKIRERRLTVTHAAELLHLSRSQVHRLLQAYDRDGANGLASRKRGRPSNRRHTDDFRNLALDLVRENYADFGPTLAVEKLREWHQVSVSKETLRKWMTEAGLGRHAANVDGNCINRAVGAIASANWFRSMARITGGLRTAVRSAPCSFISTTPRANCCICALPLRRTPSTTSMPPRRISRNGASQSPFTATSMAYSAPRIRQRRTALLA